MPPFRFIIKKPGQWGSLKVAHQETLQNFTRSHKKPAFLWAEPAVPCGKKYRWVTNRRKTWRNKRRNKRKADTSMRCDWKVWWVIRRLQSHQSWTKANTCGGQEGGEIRTRTSAYLHQFRGDSLFSFVLYTVINQERPFAMNDSQLSFSLQTIKKCKIWFILTRQRCFKGLENKEKSVPIRSTSKAIKFSPRPLERRASSCDVTDATAATLTSVTLQWLLMNYSDQTFSSSTQIFAE